MNRMMQQVAELGGAALISLLSGLSLSLGLLRMSVTPPLGPP
ncbi:hypothetical protein [Deinococcus rubellus]